MLEMLLGALQYEHVDICIYVCVCVCVCVIECSGPAWTRWSNQIMIRIVEKKP